MYCSGNLCILSMYPTDTTRSKTQCSTIILQSVSIQIQHSMYSSMCIVQIQLALELANPINNTLVSINPDTALYVFSRVCIVQILSLFSVCIII